MHDRVHGAIGALCAAQDEDGGWTDFEVAGMGASGPWVTAAIGLRLAGLPPAFATAATARAVERAIGYVEAAETWSYNHKAPQDADSVAHAMLLLATAGKARASAVRALLGFQTVDGGFSTFAQHARGADYASWSISHPDVTPVAIRALAPHAADPDVAQALARADVRLATDRSDGRWPAFWWGLDWYTAAAWARVARARWEPPVRPGDGRLRAPLDAAYLLEVALACGWDGVALTMAEVLAGAEALPGGLWAPVPALRVTAPHVTQPWTLPGVAGGRLYSDVRGLYSSSVIAAALAQHAERFAS